MGAAGATWLPAGQGPFAGPFRARTSFVGMSPPTRRRWERQFGASSDPEARAVTAGQALHHFIDGNDFGAQEGHGTAVGGLVPNAGNIKVPKVVSR